MNEARFGAQNNMGSTETADTARHFGEQAKESTKRFADQAKDAAMRGKEKAATGFGSAGERIRERTEGKGGVREVVGAKVATGLETAGDYLQNHEYKEMVEDIEGYVKKHPMQTVAGAVFAGIIIGRMLRK